MKWSLFDVILLQLRSSKIITKTCANDRKSFPQYLLDEQMIWLYEIQRKNRIENFLLSESLKFIGKIYFCSGSNLDYLIIDIIVYYSIFWKLSARKTWNFHFQSWAWSAILSFISLLWKMDFPDMNYDLIVVAITYEIFLNNARWWSAFVNIKVLKNFSSTFKISIQVLISDDLSSYSMISKIIYLFYKVRRSCKIGIWWYIKNNLKKIFISCKKYCLLSTSLLLNTFHDVIYIYIYIILKNVNLLRFIFSILVSTTKIDRSIRKVLLFICMKQIFNNLKMILILREVFSTYGFNEKYFRKCEWLVVITN